MKIKLLVRNRFSWQICALLFLLSGEVLALDVNEVNQFLRTRQSGIRVESVSIGKLYQDEFTHAVYVSCLESALKCVVGVLKQDKNKIISIWDESQLFETLQRLPEVEILKNSFYVRSLHKNSSTWAWLDVQFRLHKGSFVRIGKTYSSGRLRGDGTVPEVEITESTNYLTGVQITTNRVDNKSIRKTEKLNADERQLRSLSDPNVELSN